MAKAKPFIKWAGGKGQQTVRNTPDELIAGTIKSKNHGKDKS